MLSIALIDCSLLGTETWRVMVKGVMVLRHTRS